MNDLEADAERAALVGKIRLLVAWGGDRRKLTQTGKITLADARHLVELLGTGDSVEPRLKEILGDPSDEEYDELKIWAQSQLRGEFDPVRFVAYHAMYIALYASSAAAIAPTAAVTVAGRSADARALDSWPGVDAHRTREAG